MHLIHKLKLFIHILVYYVASIFLFVFFLVSKGDHHGSTERRVQIVGSVLVLAHDYATRTLICEHYGVSMRPYGHKSLASKGLSLLHIL